MDGVFFKPGIRFNQLQETVNGISPKVLAQQLNALQKQGIVRNLSKTEKGEKISKYFLTPQGKDLQQALKTLKDWGIRWKHVPPTCTNTSCAACKLEFAKK